MSECTWDAICKRIADNVNFYKPVELMGFAPVKSGDVQTGVAAAVRLTSNDVVLVNVHEGAIKSLADVGLTIVGKGQIQTHAGETVTGHEDWRWTEEWEESLSPVAYMLIDHYENKFEYGEESAFFVEDDATKHYQSYVARGDTRFEATVGLLLLLHEHMKGTTRCVVRTAPKIVFESAEQDGQVERTRFRARCRLYLE